MNRSPAFLKASARFAAELAGDLFEPDESGVYWHHSRKDPPTPGSPWRCDLDLYGVPVCSCPGYSHHGHCWFSDQLKEVLMTTETEETGTALVPVEFSPQRTLLPTPRELSTIREIAGMAAAGAVALPQGITRPEQVAALMLYGRALGIDPMISLQELYLVNGRVTPSARLMAALVMKAEPDARLLTINLTYSECTMRLIRPSRGIDTTYTVTWADIEKAKLAGGNNALYPKDRLAYHCTKRILRINTPDLLLNMGAAAGMVLALDDEEPDPDDDPDIDMEAEFRKNNPGVLEAEVTAPTRPKPPAPPEPPPEGPPVVTTPEEARSAIDRLRESKAKRQAPEDEEPPPPDAEPTAANGEPMTTPQNNMIFALGSGRGWTPTETRDQVREWADRPVHELTKAGASRVIEWLKGLPAREEGVPSA